MINSLKEYKKSAQPFEDYLQDIFSLKYFGLDDEMPDRFEDWISNLEPEDLIKHGNAFSKLLLDLINAD